MVEDPTLGKETGTDADEPLPDDTPEIIELRDELFGLLGEKDDFKRWLAGSLWKNISVQTERHAYPMKRWVELVHIAEDHLEQEL